MSTVLLVDDHPLVRQAMRSALAATDDLRVVGEARDGDEAMALARDLRPDLVLLDIRLPGTNGIEVARYLRRELQDIRVVMLSSYDLDVYVRACFAIGVHGYLVKSASDAEVVTALRAVLRGEQWVSPEIAITAARVGLDGKRELSERERQVLGMAAEGSTNKAIALGLSLKESTVESYLKNAFTKLGVGSRMQAVQRALEEGLIVPRD
jgi:DNA-binding NarL/FixJ family response regulator